MLETLRRIVQDVSAAPDLSSALAITVNRIRDAMQVAACTVYLADEDNREYVLMATAGLNPQAVGRVRLNRQQGLIGLVAERQEPVNLPDAPRHPRFHPVCEVCEESYHAFLGVPLIQYRRVLGVLLIQDAATRQFHPAEVDFLVTIAAQLASTSQSRHSERCDPGTAESADRWRPRAARRSGRTGRGYRRGHHTPSAG